MGIVVGELVAYDSQVLQEHIYPQRTELAKVQDPDHRSLGFGSMARSTSPCAGEKMVRPVE